MIKDWSKVSHVLKNNYFFANLLKIVLKTPGATQGFREQLLSFLVQVSETETVS